MAYTPGPWKAVVGILDDPTVVTIVGDFGSEPFVAIVPPYWLNRDANIKLIVAAPDLIEALEAVVSIADRKTDEFDKAHAAIKKAKGE